MTDKERLNRKILDRQILKVAQRDLQRMEDSKKPVRKMMEEEPDDPDAPCYGS